MKNADVRDDMAMKNTSFGMTRLAHSRITSLQKNRLRESGAGVMSRSFGSIIVV
jgi:hypothetical protein